MPGSSPGMSQGCGTALHPLRLTTGLGARPHPLSGSLPGMVPAVQSGTHRRSEWNLRLDARNKSGHEPGVWHGPASPPAHHRALTRWSRATRAGGASGTSDWMPGSGPGMSRVCGTASFSPPAHHQTLSRGLGYGPVTPFRLTAGRSPGSPGQRAPAERLTSPHGRPGHAGRGLMSEACLRPLSSFWRNISTLTRGVRRVCLGHDTAFHHRLRS